MSDRALLRHLLAALAYRTQKALRGAPAHYPDFAAGHGARTPSEILRHMTSLMGYTATLFGGDAHPRHPEPLPSFDEEIDRFHDRLERVAELIDSGRRARDPATEEPLATERLLQGPLADAMTHVGQLAFLRRLSGSPVPGESFIHADIDARRLRTPRS